jgi:hypothetical protein
MRKTLEIDNGEECTIASQMFNNFMMADSRRNLMQDLVIKITDEAQGYEINGRQVSETWMAS